MEWQLINGRNREVFHANYPYSMARRAGICTEKAAKLRRKTTFWLRRIKFRNGSGSAGSSQWNCGKMLYF